MTTQLAAVYEHGVLRPLQPLDWAEGMRIELMVVSATPAKQLQHLGSSPIHSSGSIFGRQLAVSSPGNPGRRAGATRRS